MNQFLAYLIKNLVDDPEAVDVKLIENPQGIVMEVRVATGDIAKVVGRQGRTIKALRTLAMTVGARFGRRVRVELMNSGKPVEAACSESCEEESSPS